MSLFQGIEEIIRRVPDSPARGGVRHPQQTRRGQLWLRVQSTAQGVQPDPGHQASARRHGPAGNHQGDLNYATV